MIPHPVDKTAFVPATVPGEVADQVLLHGPPVKTDDFLVPGPAMGSNDSIVTGPPEEAGDFRVPGLTESTSDFMVPGPHQEESEVVVPESPRDIANVLLFRIERSRDPDEIWYMVNIQPDGSVNRSMPVKVFWVKKSEKGRIEPLTRIQKRFSYGILESEPVSPARDEWNFKLAAYRDREFTMKRINGDQFRVYTHSGNREVEVKKLYVEFDGGSFLSPSIAFVELTGMDHTGLEIKEFITGRNHQSVTAPEAFQSNKR